MKNSALALGGLLILINTAAGLVFSSYNPFNMAMADASILLSTALIYGVYKSTIADGFKIGFTIVFAITGLIRFICSLRGMLGIWRARWISTRFVGSLMFAKLPIPK